MMYKCTSCVPNCVTQHGVNPLLDSTTVINPYPATNLPSVSTIITQNECSHGLVSTSSLHLKNTNEEQ